MLNTESLDKSNLERQVFHLRTLYEIADSLSVCKDSSQIHREVLSILMGTFGVEYGFSLILSQSQEWRLAAERGFDDDSIATLDTKLQRTRFALKATSAKQTFLEDFVTAQNNRKFTAGNVCWTEFAGRNRAMGGVFLGEKLSGDNYHGADHELLQAVALQVTAALENLQLYDNLKEAQDRLQLENIALREEVLREYEGGRIIGQSEEILKILQQARNMAKSPTNVLIYGETGTGKELVAKTIHYLSPRKEKPFVAVNCTAIPETLVESELFGIDAGVATGVKKHIGFFEQADTGTLFIDEIGDMPLSSQAKILRAVQERCFRRVGGTKEISVDVRVIVATNKDLIEEMRKGTFREDLYFRLSVLDLRLPPLRSRRDDIPLLANHFVQKIAKKLDKRIRGFSTKAMRLLMEYDWPGNVRELENEIERAITLGDNPTVQAEELSQRINHSVTKLELPNALTAQSLREALDALERHLIEQALEKYHWNKSEVSRKLRISRLGLQKKLDRLGITRKRSAEDF